MKRRILSFILTISMALSGMLIAGPVTVYAAASGNWTDAANVAAAYADGDGSSGNPYQIATAEQLALLAQNTASNANEADGYPYSTNKYFIITADIDLADHYWVPIGYFYGHLDGQNHKISNLTIDTSSNDQGLIGIAQAGATVSNINITGCTIATTGVVAGALIGEVEGTASSQVTISHCTSSGTVKGSQTVGGVAGYAVYISISECSSSCTITATISPNSSTDARAGGLIGMIWHSSGNVVSGCSATGSVTGSANLGGLIGCFAASNNSQTLLIENSYATGRVATTRDNMTPSGYGGCYLGGLIGAAEYQPQINNSYTTSSLYVWRNDYPGMWGGVVGWQDHGVAGAMTNTYFNADNLNGSNASGQNSAVPKTMTEMQDSSFAATLNSAQSPSPWAVDEHSKNGGFPILKWQWVPDVSPNATTSGITATSATCSGIIVDNGYDISEKGIVYSTSPDPDVTDSGDIQAIAVGTATGAFSKGIYGLQPDTKYYYRIFATNSLGTAYSAEKNFKTAAPAGPTLQNAATNTAGNQITLTFSKAMADPTGKHGQFKVTSGGIAVSVTGAALVSGNTSEICLSLGSPVSYGDIITLGYTPGTVAAADTGLLASVSSMTVTNNVPPPVTYYTVTLNKNGGSTEASPASITVTSGSSVGTLPTAPSRSGYTFTGWNTMTTGGGLTFTSSTSVTASITVYAQWSLNSGPAPILQSAATNTAGNQITLTFSKAMADPTGKHGQFKVTSGGIAVSVTGAALVSGNTSAICLTLASPVSYGNTVTLGYTPGTVAAADAGLLASVSSMTVTNNTTQTDDRSGGSGGGTSVKPPTVPKVITEKSEQSTINKTEIPAENSSGKVSASVSSEVFDAILSKAASTNGAGQGDTLELNIDAPKSAQSLQATLAQNDLEKVVARTDASLSLSSPFITVSFDAKALETISGAGGGGSVVISASKVDVSALSAADKEKVSGRPVYDLSVKSGGRQVSDFEGGLASVTIPYTLDQDEDPSAVVVFYLANDGSLQAAQGYYNRELKSVVCKTPHFSKFVVSYNLVEFSDVSAGAWYADAVEFLAARGITTGAKSGGFLPGQSITRAQFLVMLMRAYSISPETSPVDNFSDAGSTYYTGYLASAKTLGITEGIGSNKFAPDRKITRQEMSVMLYNALQAIDQLPQSQSGKTLSDFDDTSSLPSWAEDAMTLLVAADVMTGSGDKLRPAATATRAEMAQLLYNLLTR